MSTGDELVDIDGATLAGNRIYDCNRHMLAELMRQTGAKVNDLGIVRDRSVFFCGEILLGSQYLLA